MANWDDDDFEVTTTVPIVAAKGKWEGEDEEDDIPVPSPFPSRTNRLTDHRMNGTLCQKTKSPKQQQALLPQNPNEA
jgi:hypothetical protein